MRISDWSSDVCSSDLKGACGSVRGEVPQHVLEDAAVEEIFQLVDGIDPAAGGEPLGLAVGAGEGDLDILARADVADAVDREGFRAVELERLKRHALGDLPEAHTPTAIGRQPCRESDCQYDWHTVIHEP